MTSGPNIIGADRKSRAFRRRASQTRQAAMLPLAPLHSSSTGLTLTDRANQRGQDLRRRGQSCIPQRDFLMPVGTMTWRIGKLT